MQTEKERSIVKKHLTKAWFMRKNSILITENLFELFSKITVIFHLRMLLAKSSCPAGFIIKVCFTRYAI